MLRKRIAILSPLAMFLFPLAASAAEACNPPAGAQPAGGLLTGISLQCSACGTCQIPDFFIVGNNVVNLLLGLSGSFMLLMVITGGFFWLTAAGNTERIERGKKILSGAVIGLIIVFVSYTIVQFILAAVGVPNVAEIFKRPFGGK